MRSPQLLASGSTSINMTPMIDVVFLLIIFFLVSSHLAKRESNVKLDLPTAQSGLDEDTESTMVVVNVLADGSWQVAGDRVNLPRLNQLLIRIARQSAEPLRLKIRTDSEVGYSRIEPVLQAASKAGIGDIVFAVLEGPRP